MIYYLNVEIVRAECHPDTVKYFTRTDDPIAPFETADMGLLDSALQQPKWDYYPTLEKKAAVLLYGLIKNHAFENGNKRIAVVCLITFLYLNDQQLTANDDELTMLALAIAESSPADREKVLEKTEKEIKKYLETVRE